jgi:hypothetical protein
MKGSAFMRNTAQVATSEIADSDLDSISGGISISGAAASGPVTVSGAGNVQLPGGVSVGGSFAATVPGGAASGNVSC